MRQLIQHRIKTNIIGKTGHVMRPGQYVKKPLLDQSLRAIQGWTGLQNCYIQQPATFAGNSALKRVIQTSSEINQGTISFWFWVDVGAGAGNRKYYDIGDLDGGAGFETTRFMSLSGAQALSTLAHTPNAGLSWSVVAAIVSASVSEGEWHHYYIAYKNDTIDGTSIAEVYIDGVFSNSTAFNPTSETISLVATDGIVIGARHDVDTAITEGVIGKMADVWTTDRYMEPSENVPFFVSSITTPEYVNCTPKYIAKTMNGFIANNFLGGQGYTINDWNNGVNRGNFADFTLVGDPLT